ncbi:hypothetical protein [Streptomyces sp. NPDC048196]|uniref:hypothetical protein n=1 Tax=Streptomyces sp. NPDC048196 TaxID=3154712 RepID=UPI0033EE2C99
MPVEERTHAVGVSLAEARHIEVGGLEVAGAGEGPGAHLQRLVVVFSGPGGDLVERQAGQACGVETEFHLVSSPF